LSEALGPLKKYVPAEALPLLEPILKAYPLQLRITKPRKSKFGDYRLPVRKEPHRISINSNLNPYAFLITLLHEFAHLKAYADFGRKIKPHGPEWQNTFTQVCEPFFAAQIFPEKIAKALGQSLAKGHASSATSEALYRVLKEFDKPVEGITFVEDLPNGSFFTLGKKTLIKGPKSRKRYRCKNPHNQREYMVHPLAEVQPLNSLF